MRVAPLGLEEMRREGTMRPTACVPRLLVVTPRFLPQIGGVETHVLETARRIARMGFSVSILTTDSSGKLPREERVGDLRVRRVRAWPARKDYYFAPGLPEALGAERCDIIHLQGIHTLVGPLAMMAASRARIPFVVTMHSSKHWSWFRNAVRPLQWWLLSPLLARARHLIAVSREEADYFGALLGPRAAGISVVPNGADLQRRPTGPRRDMTYRAILSVGRLDKGKGHHRVIEAMPIVLDREPDVRLWIVGSGPYERVLRRLVSRLGIEDRVTIQAIPPLERSAMAEALASAALVTLLSDGENNPLAVLEALSMARPVLVAESPGLSIFVERGQAMGVPRNAGRALIAEAIVSQLRNPIIPSGVSLPTWDDAAESLKKIYVDILDNETGGPG